MKTREANFELLSVISMIMIITLHLFNYGGGLSRTDYLTVNYNLTWFIEALCFVAVNCYFLVDKKFSLKRMYIYILVCYVIP